MRVFILGWLHRWIVRPLRFYWRYMPYCYEICAAWVLVVADLFFLREYFQPPFPLYWAAWAHTLLWALYPALRLDGPPLSPMLFWNGTALLPCPALILVVAHYFYRDGRTKILLWSTDANQQLLKVLRGQRAHLAYLYLRARNENEEYEVWRNRRHWRAGAREYPTDPPTIRSYVGLWSFTYVILSRLLGVEPATLDFGDAGDGTLPAELEVPAKEVPAQVSSQYQLFLFGTVHFVFVGEEVIKVSITSLRQRELLAYLALSAREREATWEDVVANVYEAHPSEHATVQTLQDDFHNDVRSIRKLFKSGCAEAGLPEIDPIVLSGPGKKQRYQLNEAIEVADVARLERLSDRLKTIITLGAPFPPLAQVRTAALEALVGSKDGFLGRMILEQRTGPWASEYYHRYEELSQRLLWNLAEYLYALRDTTTGQERQTILGEAGKLYERCMLLTAPTTEEERQQGASLSEPALRKCLVAYRDLHNLTLVHHTYAYYVRTMQRRFLGWKAEPQTVQVFQEAVRSLEQGS